LLAWWLEILRQSEVSRLNSEDELSPDQAQKKRLAGLFGRAAPTYDHVGPPFFRYFGKRLVEDAGVSPGIDLLDIASGRGATLFPAAKAVGFAGRVVGTDYSWPMVHEAAREIGNNNLSNVDVEHMDAEKLQFPDETFDLVVCGFAIFLFPNLMQAMSEFYRVLKPVGKIAVSTFAEIFNEDWTWLDELFKKYLPAETEEVVKPIASSNGHTFNTDEGLSEILKSAGFFRVQVTSETKDFIYTDEEEWWTSMWSHGGRQSMERLQEVSGVDILADFQFEAFEELRKMKQADGIHQEITALFGVGRKL